ncbi:MAG: RNA-binding domain-containing protein [Candidatus Heimdallarchaeota archaeon]
MFKITVMTKQNPTEDPEKIKQALSAILPGEVKSKKFGNEVYLYKESKKYRDLDIFYDLVRHQRILDVARKTLRNNTVGNSTRFFINKQVAFVGKINFCDEEGESPLGPIRIEIEYKNIERLIDWLTPYTKNGAEVKLVKSFP